MTVVSLRSIGCVPKNATVSRKVFYVDFSNRYGKAMPQIAKKGIPAYKNSYYALWCRDTQELFEILMHDNKVQTKKANMPAIKCELMFSNFSRKILVKTVKPKLKRIKNKPRRLIQFQPIAICWFSQMSISGSTTLVTASGRQLSSSTFVLGELV